MSAVQHHAGHNGLHASLPAGLSDACETGFERNLMVFINGVQRHKSQRTVHHLVVCQIGHLDSRMFIIPTIQVKINAFVRLKENFTHGRIDRISRASQLFGPGEDDFFGLGRTSVIDHRHAGLDDAGLLKGDLLDGIAQDLRVIQADRRDDRRQRMLHGVGGIEAAAQAGLQHHILGFQLLKEHHGHAEEQFKVGRMRKAVRLHALYHIENLQKSGEKFLIGNHLVVDLEALVDLHQMGGCKEGCPLSRLGQHRGEEGTDGTFSVGPRHMDDLHRTLRMAQTV